MDNLEFTPLTGNYEFEVRAPECTKYSYPKFLKEWVDNYAIGQLPPGYAANGNFGPKVSENNWGELCLEFPMAVCILVLATLVPLAGIACCMLRRMKKSSSDKCETRCQRRCRWCSYLLLLILTCMMLNIPLHISIWLVKVLTTCRIGLWVAFANNWSLMKTAADANVYVEKFLEKVEDDINHVTIRNYMELGDYYVASMADLITEWLQYREQEFRKLTFHKMDQISNGMSEITNKLRSIEVEVNKLECNFTLLLDYLRFYSRNVSIYLGLHHTGHRVLKDTSMGSLNKKSIQLKDIDAIYRSARKTYQIAESLSGRFGLAGALHETISVSVNKSLLKYSSGVKNFMDTQANEFKAIGRKILTQIANESTSAPAAGKEKSNNTIPDSLTHSGLIACVLLLVIGLLLILGLVIAAYATLGKNGSTDKRAFAARVLKCTIIAILVLFSPIALITCIHFLYGTVVNNGICASTRLARKDRSSQSILYTCSGNETIYAKMLAQGKVEKVSHSGNPLKFDGVTKALIESVIHTNIKEFPQNYTSEAIKSLVKSATHSFSGVICTDLRAPLQLDYLTSVLDRVAMYCEVDSGGIDNYLLFLPYSAIRKERCICLQNYYRTTILNNFIEFGMIPRMTKIDKDCDILRSYFPEGLQTSTEDYLAEIDKLFKFYKEDLKVDLNSLAVKLKYVYKRQFDQYMSWLKKTFENDIGKCGTVAASQGKEFDTTCKCAIDPLNGYWSGMCLALFALLPIVILGKVLAKLLKKPCVDYTNSNKNNTKLTNDPNNENKVDQSTYQKTKPGASHKNSESEADYLSDENTAAKTTQIFPKQAAEGSQYDSNIVRPSRVTQKTMSPSCVCDIDPNKLKVRTNIFVDGNRGSDDEFQGATIRANMGELQSDLSRVSGRRMCGSCGREIDPNKKKARTKIIIDGSSGSNERSQGATGRADTEERRSGQSDRHRVIRTVVPQDVSRVELGECNQGSRRKRIVIKYIHKKPSSQL